MAIMVSFVFYVFMIYVHDMFTYNICFTTLIYYSHVNRRTQYENPVAQAKRTQGNLA